MLACLREAERARVRLVVLGNGSNLLAADGEIPCFAVLLTGLDALERTGEREIWAGAGVSPVSYTHLTLPTTSRV